MKQPTPLTKIPDYFIEGVCFENILSFEHFELIDFRRINVFIGGNSSGKSNIIRAIIGFRVDNDNSNSAGHICFADGTVIDHPLNNDKSNYRSCYFEIPPFRNLIILEGCALDRINWRSGIIDMSKIRENEIDFYEELEKIIGIEGFRLYGCTGVPNISYDERERRINSEQWTNWGWYTRKVKDQDKEIPIDNLGWGTKSAIIIFYNLFFNKNAIVFIEEPEISMHPELLKKLFTWAFRERPGCQFFITTHSSMLIDKIFLGRETKELGFYEIYSEKGITHGCNLNEKLDQIRLLEQMGFQSSNLLFANYVIWVEGPSDIFYYEALLNIMDKLNGDQGIKRGVHYELMWYGGRQVKNMSDIKSKEGLNLLFSFGRKGAIFWDYDGKDKYARDLARRIKNFKEDIEQKSNSFICLHFGCTGRMMTGCETAFSTEGLPVTIENLMSKDFAEIALEEAKIKKNREVIAKAFEDNEKPKGINSKKKVIGMAFLNLITEGLGLAYCKPEDVFRSAIAPARCGTIMTFFSELYQNILKANELQSKSV